MPSNRRMPYHLTCIYLKYHIALLIRDAWLRVVGHAKHGFFHLNISGFVVLCGSAVWGFLIPKSDIAVGVRLCLEEAFLLTVLYNTMKYWYSVGWGVILIVRGGVRWSKHRCAVRWSRLWREKLMMIKVEKCFNDNCYLGSRPLLGLSRMYKGFLWKTGAPDGMSARRKHNYIIYKYWFRNINPDVRETSVGVWSDIWLCLIRHLSVCDTTSVDAWYDICPL